MPDQFDVRELSTLIRYTEGVGGRPVDNAATAIATLRLAIAAERIADALEGMDGAKDPLPIGIQQAETVQPTAPDQLPTCVGKGWIHGVTPSATCLAQPCDLVKVYVPSRSTGWELRTASLVTDEDLWAPMHVDSSPLFKKLTLWGSGVQP